MPQTSNRFFSSGSRLASCRGKVIIIISNKSGKWNPDSSEAVCRHLLVMWVQRSSNDIVYLT